MTKIISWNLLRLTGATIDDLVRLVRRERPDVLLMQEATVAMAALPQQIGGFFARVPLPGRIHGLAVWTPTPHAHPRVIHLPSGALVDRVCQIIDLPGFSVANVHLSHGQVLNRRQLRYIAGHLPYRAAVLGDYNLVGPALLPGFRDVGRARPRIAARTWCLYGWIAATRAAWSARNRPRWTAPARTIAPSWCGWKRPAPRSEWPPDECGVGRVSAA